MQLFLCLAIATIIALSHSEARERSKSIDPSAVPNNPSETQGTRVDKTQALTHTLDTLKIRVKQGDTLLKILSDAGVPASEGNKAINALAKKIDLRKLQAGQILHLFLLPRATPSHPFRLVGLILDQGRDRNWTLYRNKDYRFSTQQLPFQQANQTVASALTLEAPDPDGRFSREIVVRRGDTLIGLLRAAGADHHSAFLASREMGKQLNLRKLQAGQSIKLIFELSDQQKTNTQLISVSMELKGNKVLTVGRRGKNRFINPALSHSKPSQITTKRTDDIKSAPDQEAFATPTSIATPGNKGAHDNNPERRTKGTFLKNTIQLNKGDILFERILSLGANRSDTHEAISVLRKHIDLRRLHVGQKITVLFYARTEGTRDLAGLNIPRKGQKTIEVGFAIGKGFSYGPPEPELFTANVSETIPTPQPSSAPLSGPDSQNTSSTKKTASLQQTPLKIPANRQMELMRINRGDTLSGLLKRSGSTAVSAKHAIQSIRKVYDPDLIRIGQRMVAEFEVDGHGRQLARLIFGIDKHRAIVVELSGNEFEARKTSGKALADAISLTKKINSARSALASGTYTTQTREIYGFDTAETDLIDLRHAKRVKVALEPGDTLFEAILDAGAPRLDANAAIAAAKKILDPRKLKAGQHLALAFVNDPAAKADPNKKRNTFKLAELAIDLSADQRLRVARLQDGAFISGLVERPLNRELRRASGTIQNSLYKTADAMGLPAEVLVKLIRIFSYDVDFQRDIRKGDEFEALYESYTDEDGEMVKGSALLYASMTLSGTKLPLFQYTLDDGLTDYFDEDGQSVRKALMRTPIDGARLTSSYGKRKHPTLGYSKMHRGVDFGAPKGTPIFAAGDGIVEEATRNGAYGKYIRLRHGTKYQTAYAHLSRYAKGIQRGKRVKQGQIIGYVGSTGRSTGPHLHYEVLINQKQVNPLGVNLPTGLFLKGEELDKFRIRRDQLSAAYASVPMRQTLAGKDKPE